MSKKIIVIALISAILIGAMTVYSTFALNEESTDLEKSTADYNLIYSIKENSDTRVTIGANETKFVNISLTNTYTSTVKYGMYYYLENPTTMPNNVTISLSSDSKDILENIIKPQNKRQISIKIDNDSENTVTLTVGALIGFENGNIASLATNGEVLIK